MKVMKDLSDWGMTDIEGFLEGIKPSIFISPKIEPKHYKEYINYPSTPNPREEEPAENFIFFQNDLLKDQFLDRLEKITMDSVEYDRLLGKTLGFPPEAIEYYVKPYGTDRERVLHHYGGLHFVGHINDLLTNARWVWDNYPQINETFKFSHDLKTFEIEFQDFHSLNKQRESFLKSLDQ